MDNEKKILETLAKVLYAEWGDEPPCNFNDYDAYMFDHCQGYCEKNCDNPDHINCWQEWIKAKLKENGVTISDITPKYKKGDTVYHIEWVGTYIPEKGSILNKEPVAYKVKSVHIGKTKVSYSLDRAKSRMDESWLFATKEEAQAILDRGK